MKKKLCFLCLLVACLFSLTGCRAVDALEYSFNNMKSGVREAKVDYQLNKSAMSTSTKNLGLEVQKKNKNLKTMQDIDSEVHDVFLVGPLFSKLLTKPIVTSFEAQSEKAYSDYNTALENDAIYQSNKPLAKLDWRLIALIGVIILVILLFVFIASRSRKAPKRVVVPESYSPAVHKHDVSVGPDVKVNYKRLLKDNCKKLGISESDMLAKHNGDARAAYEETNLM